jgi:hypothetical protein
MFIVRFIEYFVNFLFCFVYINVYFESDCRVKLMITNMLHFVLDVAVDSVNLNKKYI